MVVAAQSDAHWVVRQFGVSRLLVGMPDVEDASHLSFLGSTFDDNAPPEAAVFKIGFGFSICGQKREASLGHFLRRFNQLAFVLEPYFALDVEVEQRIAFIREARKFSNVLGFKLDVADTAKFSCAYTEAAAPKPWFARSDGLGYDDFRHRASYSVARGCFGVIAGAAVWRSEVHNFRATGTRTMARQTVLNRISGLRIALNERA